jgi:TPR repeat protein
MPSGTTFPLWRLFQPLFWLTVLIAVAPPSAAQEEAQASTERPLITKVRERAQSGDLDAKYELAQIYEKGKHGVDRSLAEAARWYRSAGSAGHVLSQRRLAEMHLYGEGVPQSFEQAQHWYFLAANKNDFESQYHLAILFLTGRGVAKSVDTGLKWLKASANAGYAPAQVELGRLYIEGIDVPQDVESGLDLVRRAARDDNPEALYFLGRLHEEGIHINQSPTRAKSYIEDAANQGHAEAQVWLADWYTLQEPPDYEQALRYYRLASEQGFAAGDFGFARIHLRRLSRSPDAQAGLRHLRRAVKANYPDAHYLMGMIIADGALPGGAKEAVYSWERAAAMGHLEAQYQLGITYYQGARGIPKSLPTAEQWWKEAARRGHPGSQFAYGLMHLHGIGVPVNRGVGYALINIAAAQGHEDASAMRAQLQQALPEQTLISAQLLSVEMFEKYVDPSLREASRERLQ